MDLVETGIIGNGTAVLESGGIGASLLAIGKWHRSKDTKQRITNSFASFMINKKWVLEEQFNLHMMRFQQVKNIAGNQVI